MNRYAIEIFYSKEDEGFIAIAPELPGCSAFGATEEKALQEAKEAIDLWVEAAKSEGRDPPKPNPEHYISRLSEEDWEIVDATIALNRLNDPNDKVVSLEKAKEMLGL